MSTIKAHLYFCRMKPHNGKNRILPWLVYRGDWSRTDNCFMQNLTFLLQCGVLVCTAVILCRIGLFVFIPSFKIHKKASGFLHFHPAADCFGARGANGSQQKERGDGSKLLRSLLHFD